MNVRNKTLRSRAWLIVTAFLVLTAAYPFSSGPAYYVVGRWPSTRSVYWLIYAPINTRVNSESPLIQTYRRYLHWWYRLGWDHSGRPWIRFSRVTPGHPALIFVSRGNTEGHTTRVGTSDVPAASGVCPFSGSGLALSRRRGGLRHPCARSAHLLAAHSTNVSVIRRTSITDSPGMSSARSTRSPRPLFSEISPRSSVRNSFICDSAGGRGRVS